MGGFAHRVYPPTIRKSKSLRYGREMFDELRDKAKNLLEGHDEQVDGGVDKARDMIDERTDGKYSEHLQTGAEKAKEALDRFLER
jgi:MT0933-like antitoxin protein